MKLARFILERPGGLTAAAYTTHKGSDCVGFEELGTGFQGQSQGHVDNSKFKSVTGTALCGTDIGDIQSRGVVR